MPKVVKFALWAGVLIVLWQLWQSDAVLNAVLQFCTAGIVPGTKAVLTPQQTYFVLGCVLLLVVCVLFRHQLARDIRAFKRFMRRAPQSPAEYPEAATTTANPKTKKPQPVVIITVPRKPGYIAKLVRCIAPRAKPALLMVRRTSYRVMLWAWAVARYQTIAFCTWLVYQWWRVEPQLRQFDRWLERTLKKSASFRASLRMVGDCNKAMQTMVAEVRARVSRVVEK